jgi:hypothetical protein
MTQTANNPQKTPLRPKAHDSKGFTEIGVRGFKSFAEETLIQLGSLTILAGANSSGKSSIMQPLLLMKQILETPYDPGSLLLDGPNASYTSGEQILTKLGKITEQGVLDTPLVRGFDLRRSPYIGLAKTHLHNVVIATGTNITRLMTWLNGKPKAATRVSPFGQIKPISTINYLTTKRLNSIQLSR